MIESLLPTAWFADYWVDYAPVARANIEEAGRLADEVGDEQLSLEVEAASLRFVRGPEAAELGERLRERLEARHDPVRLKEHYFWLMWHYLGRGELLRCVQTCDLGIELARQLGSAPVQYGSIKALALTELGRYDLVDAALDEEVTDDEHPFGQANQAFARASYLGAIEAWEPAAVAALDAMQRGAALSRVWMQQGMLTVATSLRAHGATAMAEAMVAIDAIADANGIRPTALARAEVELAEGRVSGAREELERVVGPLTTNDLRRDLTHALELLARVLSDLGQWDDALDVMRPRPRALRGHRGGADGVATARLQGPRARSARAERRGGRRPSPRHRRLRYTRPSDPRPRAASLVQPPTARRTLAGVIRQAGAPTMTGLRDGTPEEAGLSASRLAHASELAASFVESGDHPAVVVLVARHGVVAFHEAFGKLGPKPDEPPLPRDALFTLASIGEDASPRPLR